MKEWLLFREENLCSITTIQDKKYYIYFDEISEKILNSIPKRNREFVKKQLNKLDDNFMDYVGYWDEKYYRNGFCDAVQLFLVCVD